MVLISSKDQVMRWGPLSCLQCFIPMFIVSILLLAARVICSVLSHDRRMGRRLVLHVILTGRGAQIAGQNCDTVKIFLNWNKHLILRTSSMVWAGLIVHLEDLREGTHLLPACFWPQAGNKSFHLASWPALTFRIVHNYTN